MKAIPLFVNKSDVKEGRHAKEYKAGVGAVCKLPLLALSEGEKGKKMLMAVGGQHCVDAVEVPTKMLRKHLEREQGSLNCWAARQ